MRSNYGLPCAHEISTCQQRSSSYTISSSAVHDFWHFVRPSIDRPIELDPVLILHDPVSVAPRGSRGRRADTSTRRDLSSWEERRPTRRARRPRGATSSATPLVSGEVQEGIRGGTPPRRTYTTVLPILPPSPHTTAQPVTIEALIPAAQAITSAARRIDDWLRQQGASDPR